MACTISISAVEGYQDGADTYLRVQGLVLGPQTDIDNINFIAIEVLPCRKGESFKIQQGDPGFQRTAPDRISFYGDFIVYDNLNPTNYDCACFDQVKVNVTAVQRPDDPTAGLIFMCTTQWIGVINCETPPPPPLTTAPPKTPPPTTPPPTTPPPTTPPPTTAPPKTPPPTTPPPTTPPPTTAPPTTRPPTTRPPKKLCKCKKTSFLGFGGWCYVFGFGLSAITAIYILGAFNCFISNVEQLSAAVLDAMSNISFTVGLIDTIGIGTAIVWFWRKCGACCTFCFLLLGIILGIALVVIQAIYQWSLPPCTWPDGILVVAGLILIAIAYATDCFD